MNKVDEALVNRLMEETGCDRTLAVFLLTFTGGDLEGAKTILESVSKDIYVLKGKFKGTERTNLYGLFLVFFDIKREKMMSVEALVSKDERIQMVDVHQSWDSMIQLIRLGMSDKNTLPALSRDLRNALMDSFGLEENKKNYFPFIQVKNLAKIESYISPFITQVISDSSVFLDLSIEEITPFQYYKSESAEWNLVRAQTAEQSSESREAAEEIAPSGFLEGEPLITLKIEPVLDPVHGKPVSELEPGEEIWVKIIDERDVGKYLAGLLGGRDEITGLPKPIFVPVESIERTEAGNAHLTIRFGPGIMGEALVPEDVKVRVGAVAETKPPVEAESEPMDKIIKVAPYLIAALIAFLLVFIIFFR